MFPLLRLPFLCIQNVTDLWELDELYNFSLLSKRAKRISKRRKGKYSEISLNFTRYSCFQRKDDTFYCDVNMDQQKFVLKSNCYPPIDLVISSFLQIIQHVMDVFNSSIKNVELKLSYFTERALILIIDWLNGMKNDITQVRIDTRTRSMFELFMNKFRKNVDQLYLHNIKLESNGFILKLLNFKIKRKFVSIYSEWIHLDFLLSLDCEYITAFKNNLSAEDLNVFLRSWQEGKTNRNLKYAKLRMCSDLDMKEVLKDCGGELMDPRTSRIKFNDIRYHEFDDKWICGGIHIRRNDGRLAVIELTGDYLIKEDSNISEKNIEKYLKTVELWNSRDSTWEEDWFHIYIF